MTALRFVMLLLLLVIGSCTGLASLRQLQSEAFATRGYGYEAPDTRLAYALPSRDATPPPPPPSLGGPLDPGGGKPLGPSVTTPLTGDEEQLDPTNDPSTGPDSTTPAPAPAPAPTLPPECTAAGSTGPGGADGPAVTVTGWPRADAVLFPGEHFAVTVSMAASAPPASAPPASAATCPWERARVRVSVDPAVLALAEGSSMFTLSRPRATGNAGDAVSASTLMFAVPATARPGAYADAARVRLEGLENANGDDLGNQPACKQLVTCARLAVLTASGRDATTGFVGLGRGQGLPLRVGLLPGVDTGGGDEELANPSLNAALRAPENCSIGLRDLPQPEPGIRADEGKIYKGIVPCTDPILSEKIRFDHAKDDPLTSTCATRCSACNGCLAHSVVGQVCSLYGQVYSFAAADPASTTTVFTPGMVTDWDSTLACFSGSRVESGFAGFDKYTNVRTSANPKHVLALNNNLSEDDDVARCVNMALDVENGFNLGFAFDKQRNVCTFYDDDATASPVGGGNREALSYSDKVSGQTANEDACEEVEAGKGYSKNERYDVYRVNSNEPRRAIRNERRTVYSEQGNPLFYEVRGIFPVMSSSDYNIQYHNNTDVVSGSREMARIACFNACNSRKLKCDAFALKDIDGQFECSTYKWSGGTPVIQHRGAANSWMYIPDPSTKKLTLNEQIANTFEKLIK